MLVESLTGLDCFLCLAGSVRTVLSEWAPLSAIAAEVVGAEFRLVSILVLRLIPSYYSFPKEIWDGAVNLQEVDAAVRWD